MKCLAVLLLAVLLAPPAYAGPDNDMIARYCRGMIHQYRMPDRTRADCVSDTHAIEVEFSELWHQALGQALHYALWTREIAEHPAEYARWNHGIKKPLKAGIILVCRKARDTCTDHYVRLYRIIEEYRLPVTIWDCDRRTDMTLGECQEIDLPD